MSPDFPLAPESPIGLPAPLWFLLAFKALGFFLHVVPMHIWYAGMVLVAIFSLSRHPHARRFAQRLVSAMPIIIALGINFGIIPLLFIQVAYYPVFYPANILIGWFWFAVIPLLMVAYYGVYYYAFRLRYGVVGKDAVFASILSAACFLAIGFIFTNNFSLMTHSEGMLLLYGKTNVAGAVSGLGLNFSDPTLIPRWLFMFGLAIGTIAIYAYTDQAYWAKRESVPYRSWVKHLSGRLYDISIVWVGICGTWYLLGRLPGSIQGAILERPGLFLLCMLTALSPIVTWWLLRRTLRQGKATWIVIAAQAVTLGLNVLSRQWVQYVELLRFFDPSRLQVKTQWSPLVVFLLLFVAGLLTIAWMLRQVQNSLSKKE
ncbi:MAG: hypothetical protein HYU33_07240 [Candidatus Omnitrophica bacterium]|nr:hypothetical protein [Candidatus Omnitrophota bacterium]